MQNHFICRGFIFKDYVETVLKPGIKLIEEIPEAGQVIKYGGKAERYTYKPFLCEKLFTAYLHEKKYTCEQW